MTRPVPALALAALMLLVAAGASDGATDDSREVVQACEILAKIERGEPVEYDGVIVEGDLDLSSLQLEKMISEYKPSADRDDETLLSDYPKILMDWDYTGIDYSIFDSEIVTDELIIEMKIIESPIAITNSEIRGEVDFWNTIFQNPIIFTNTTFNDQFVFTATICNNRADFSESVFSSDSLFLGSNFNDTSDFSKAKFSFVNFDSTKFAKNADFKEAQFGRDALFNGVNFSRKARFDNATFGVGAYFTGVRFEEGVSFFKTRFNSFADFSCANFNDIAFFSGSQFNYQADFWRVKFSSDARFSDVVFNKKVTFNDANFNGTTDFTCTWFNEDAFFEGSKFMGTLSLTRTKYDKLFMRWHNITDGGLAYDDAAYLSLMKNFKDLGYLEDYDSCYYEYRKERRSHPWPGVSDAEEYLIRKPIDWFLQVTYGYGTKPINALFFSLGIIVGFGIFWQLIGLERPEDPSDDCSLADAEHDSILEVLVFSATVFLSGTRLFIEPPPLPKIGGRSRSLIRGAFIFERVLGALFSILFFIAISGTVVRQL